MQWNGSAFVAAPAPPFTPSQAKDAIAVSGENLLAVLDTSGGIHVLNNVPPTQPQPVPITSVSCVLGGNGQENGDVCTGTVSSIAGIQVGDSVTVADNNVSNGTWTVQGSPAAGCSPSPCIQWQGTNFGTATGGTLTDNTVGNAGSNLGKWSTIQGTASALTGGGALTFALANSATYHLNLTVPALTVMASVSHQCTRGGCILQTLTAQAYFGGPGGAHGTAGVTSSSSGYEPDNLVAAATEQGAYCDPVFDNHNGGCDLYEETCADCSGGCIVGGPISSKYGFATTGAKWLGVGQDGKTLLGGAVYCNAGQYCSSGTTPPLCAVKSPVYINTFGQPGTPDQQCALHAVWAEEIAYGSFTFSDGSVQTYCFPVADTAVPLGPAAPPLSCTTQP